MKASSSTPFAVTSMPSLSREGHELALVVAAAHYDWPRYRDDPPTLREDQPAVEMADLYHGDPANSSLRWEGQSAYARPGTDIYVTGHACTEGGRPQPFMDVVVIVGSCERRAMVIGDRVWIQVGNDFGPSRPAPFARMPLIYERSFGGLPPTASDETRSFAAHNPVGRGLYDRRREAKGQPLPNIEDPAQLLRHVRDRPRPVGFGPVARHWQGRRQFAGTYDEAWQRTRAPLWPTDMDERLFCAASPGLCATPHLLGGELVVLAGLSPEGPARFRLPRVELEAGFEHRSGTTRRPMVLDTVAIDADARTLTLIYRASLEARAQLGLMNLLGTWVEMRAGG